MRLPHTLCAGTEGAVPVLAWARRVPRDAERQLCALAREPYVVGRVAAMPDVHVSEGVAVGTVFATRHAVVPAALGGDLGCGVRAHRLGHPAAPPDPTQLTELVRRWGARIPVGDAAHRGTARAPALPTPPLSTAALARAWERLAPRQLGTLGGGNHFLELDQDASGALWLLVHSGSRGLGGAVAAHHAGAARAHGQGRLRALDTRTPEGRASLDDVGWALHFARTNRERLAAAALEEAVDVLGLSPDAEPWADVHHNAVTSEVHDGEALLVHRKGAVGLGAGERGIIPGSMGTASYLVEGLGEARSFRSCSHGAGRVLTRREARERIRPAALRAALRRVAYDEARLASLVEEAPAAYRDITEVLEDEEDLVRPVLRLVPLAVLKG